MKVHSYHNALQIYTNISESKTTSTRPSMQPRLLSLPDQVVLCEYTCHVQKKKEKKMAGTTLNHERVQASLSRTLGTRHKQLLPPYQQVRREYIKKISVFKT